MFRLSQKSDYGLILLSSLAKQGAAGPVGSFSHSMSSARGKTSGGTKTDGRLRALSGRPSTAATRVLPISSIAKKNKISSKFLSQVASELKKAGMLSSKEGVNGGYTLAKPASEIKILDVLKVLDGELVRGECFEDGHECNCGAKDMWMDMKQQMEETIGRKTVADLVV